MRNRCIEGRFYRSSFFCKQNSPLTPLFAGEIEREALIKILFDMWYNSFTIYIIVYYLRYMFHRYHEPYGDYENRQDPYPDNWEELDDVCDGYPRNFHLVKEPVERLSGTIIQRGRLYRSGYPLPAQIPLLQSEHSITDVVSLVPTTAFQEKAEEYNFQDVRFHEFPFHERRELTAERCMTIVESIIDIKKNPTRNILLHWNKWSVRTGMVVAMYRILTGQKGNLDAAIESMRYKNINGSALKEIVTEYKKYEY